VSDDPHTLREPTMIPEQVFQSVSDIADRVEYELTVVSAYFLKGRLEWESDLGTRRRQPARSVWQRVQDWVFGLFSLEDQV
jgi:hypothetical protein